MRTRGETTKETRQGIRIFTVLTGLTAAGTLAWHFVKMFAGGGGLGGGGDKPRLCARRRALWGVSRGHLPRISGQAKPWRHRSDVGLRQSAAGDDVGAERGLYYLATWLGGAVGWASRVGLSALSLPRRYCGGYLGG